MRWETDSGNFDEEHIFSLQQFFVVIIRCLLSPDLPLQNFDKNKFGNFYTFYGENFKPI